MGAPPLCTCKAMNATKGMILRVLLLISVAVSIGSNASPCSTAQNTVKTDTAQAVLDCGTNKCSSVQRNSQQSCLCKNCIKQVKDAQAASCACGLNDANSKAACKIYHDEIYRKCSGSAQTFSMSLLSLMFCGIAMLILQWH